MIETGIWHKQLLTFFLFIAALLASPSKGLTETHLSRTFFRKSPLLIRSATTFANPSVKANYQFTIEIPPQAGSSLKKIQLVQQPNLETLQFYQEKTEVFIGKNGARKIIPLEEITFESKPKNSVSLILAEGVQPGKEVTVSLRGRNPKYGGIYQFGITVFPDGDSSEGLYLGVGRIHFSQPGGWGS